MSGGCAILALGNGTVLQFEAVASLNTPSRAEKRILMTIGGSVHGGVMNCALIPLSRIPNLIATIQMAVEEANGHV